MAQRKSWREKLHVDKDLPKVISVKGPAALRRGWSTLAIPAPREVDALMKRVPRGRLITINELRARIARRHGAASACPIATGIFAWIAAHAAQEDLERGKRRVTPFWRTLKAQGEINPRYPGGAERSAALLREEGHAIARRGNRLFVANYEQALVRVRGVSATAGQSTPRQARKQAAVRRRPGKRKVR